MATTEEEQRTAGTSWPLNGNGAAGGGPLVPTGGGGLLDPQDEDFEDQPMTLVEHLKELRDRLIRMCIAILVGMIGGFFLTPYVIRYFRRVVEHGDPNARLIQTDATEYISTYLKITLYLGIAITMPILVYQLI